MLIQLKEFGRIALDFIFPPKCVNCGREGGFICSQCSAHAVTLKPPLCPICVLPLDGKGYCDCHYWQSLDSLTSPFVFEGVIRQAIIQFKYQNLRAIGSLLAELLHRHLLYKPIMVDALLAVPLHHKRLRERGYNQSALMARELARLSGISYLEGLVKNRHTVSQVASTNKRQRRNNVSSAFSCHNTAINDKGVLLVDDVATTGATLDACASALKTAGAARVYGLTLAREI
jgi:ComF family protein